MTDDERAILAALRLISLGRYGRDREFVTDLAARAERYDVPLSGKQTDYLYSLRWKYRAQLDALDAPPPGRDAAEKAHARWKANKGAGQDGPMGPEPPPHDGRLL